MDEILQKALRHIKKELQEKQISCAEEKAINYGMQLTCCQGGYTARLSVYHGKKGLSFVIQGKNSSLKELLDALTQGTALKTVSPAAPGKPLHPSGVSAWMGCDESGKGDVFGPLAGAACLIRAEEEEPLKKLGVRDSKLLTDRDISRIAGNIRDMLGERAVVTVWMPEEYNKQYAVYKSKGENLNHFLGDLHGQNIRCLLSKYKCPCIIVDKFGKEEYVLRSLKKEAVTHRIIQIERGERDTAVAAASILARQAFVDAMYQLSHTYGMVFPKGAYAGVAGTISRFRREYGDAALQYVGKLNFKNFDFLRAEGK